MKSTVPLKCLKCLDAFLTMSISGVLDNSGEEERLGWIHIISAMYRRPAFVARSKHTFYMKKSWEKFGKKGKESWEKLRHDEKSWKMFIRIFGKSWEQLVIVSWEKLKKVEKRWEKLEKVDK